MIPFYGKILVEPFEDKGVIQAPGMQTYKHAGVVTAIGEGVEFVKVGDTIFYAPHARWETSEVDGKKYHVINCDSEFVLGKIEHAEGSEV